MSDWVVYSRGACSLCESFLGELAEVLGPNAAAVRVVDIDSSDELQRRYGTKIPLLAIDGDIVCMYRVDADRIRGHLSSLRG